MVGEEGHDQLWGVWTWCHCWVPLQGVNFCFMSSSYIQGHQFHPDTQENNNEFCLELLAGVSLFSTMITKIWFWLSGVYAGIIFLRSNFSVGSILGSCKLLAILGCTHKPCIRASYWHHPIVMFLVVGHHSATSQDECKSTS